MFIIGMTVSIVEKSKTRKTVGNINVQYEEEAPSGASFYYPPLKEILIGDNIFIKIQKSIDKSKSICYIITVLSVLIQLWKR